jgi:hypothetical protein
MLQPCKCKTRCITVMPFVHKNILRQILSPLSINFNILTLVMSVTIDGYMTGFIGFFDEARDYILQFTITQVSTVTSSLPLLGSGYHRRKFS